MSASDLKRHAPATARNRGPILSVLQQVLPASGTVLEIAAGTGEHAACFAAALPELTWQPSDGDPDNLASIDAWARSHSNIRTARHLDVTSEDWGLDQADAIFCANMIHIAPWSATIGLMAGAARTLRSGAPLLLYGPFFRTDIETAASNIAFDQSLQHRNPDWGIRALTDVTATALENGLTFERLIEMPANNLCVLYRNC